SVVRDVSAGLPWTKWCVGATINLAANCLDKHRGTAVESKPAIVWEGEDGARRTWTYAELDAESCRLAAGLRALGIGKGDAVGIFLPMVPEVVAAFLAAARLGTVVVPLFSGFGAEAIAARLNDAAAVAVITAGGTSRRGGFVAMKAVLDEALLQVPSVRRVVVSAPHEAAAPMAPGRDVPWRD